jgi:flagellar assembly factor FliW
MQLETKHFGNIEINEAGIIFFKEGIPGFEDVKKYVLLAPGEADSPFRWLQSVDQPRLAFALINPFLVKTDYDIDIPEETVTELGIENEREVEIYSIVVVPEDKTKLSMNLKAPIIINASRKLAAQVVLDTDRYSVRHYILEELRKREVAGNAGFDKKKGSIDCNK